jgi:hypothetical protein
MSERRSFGFAKYFIVGVAALLAGPALAVDPVIDPMRPNEGLTATAPRQAERETKRDIERTPTLTERFGLPPVSGPLPPIVPPAPQPSVLQDPGREALPPPPLPRPQRARQLRDRDG